MRAIEAEERFEWEYIVVNSNISKQAGKCIFIRDVHKSWYATGINIDINTIDKLVELLREISDGYDIITQKS